jgi:hypothetical protein
MWTGADLLFSLYFKYYAQTFFLLRLQGRIQDFKLGGAHLKKLRRAEGGPTIFGVFRVKNHDFTPNNHIFSNFRAGAPGAPQCMISNKINNSVG